MRTKFAASATGTRRHLCRFNTEIFPIASIDHVHGTFGELLQGYTFDSGRVHHFLFTSPIVEYQVKAYLTPKDNLNQNLDQDKTKALSMLHALADETNVDLDDLVLHVKSNIPMGKGCSSSTADIVATAIAFYDYFFPQVPLPVASALISHIAMTLERGEYLLYPGITACAQEEYKAIKKYHTNMGLTIIGVDEGGKVDTVDFHATHPPCKDYSETYQKLFDQMDTALVKNDRWEVGRIATASSELHQKVLPKRSYDCALRLVDEVHACGLCVAHSGTMIGILIPSDDSAMEAKVHCIRKKLCALPEITPLPILNILES
ncbi:hypothetical protein [uncultured Propionibacterium sp.]|uniref:GHMP family kinase ATP-binding protein n=1 Tax=uncultured Propionibacterium sp. TaxID=218066 RepID=UPI00292E7A41|nr:hypothetical protein [uncultured Propionibacterium sp.]